MTAGFAVVRVGEEGIVASSGDGHALLLSAEATSWGETWARSPPSPSGSVYLVAEPWAESSRTLVRRAMRFVDGLVATSIAARDDFLSQVDSRDSHRVRLAGGASSHREPLDGRRAGRDLIVVPRRPWRDSERMLFVALDAAKLDPTRRVVIVEPVGETGGAVAVRMSSGGATPQNLVFSSDALAHCLDQAEGIVAQTEADVVRAAVAGVPALVFRPDAAVTAPEWDWAEQCGLLADEDDVFGHHFRFPEHDWARPRGWHRDDENDLDGVSGARHGS